MGWEAGEVRLGPLFTQTANGDGEDWYEVASLDAMAINCALRFLGVERGGSIDDFAASGLGR